MPVTTKNESLNSLIVYLNLYLKKKMFTIGFICFNSLHGNNNEGTNSNGMWGEGMGN